MIETSNFRSRAAALTTEEERQAIIDIVSADPTIGELMPGTGGARKFRLAGRSKGKSGGYRIISYYAADDVPVFLLDIYGKDEKDNLSKAEQNTLRRVLQNIAGDYRASVRTRVMQLRKGRRS